MSYVKRALRVFRKLGLKNAIGAITSQVFVELKHSLGVQAHGPLAKKRILLGNRLEKEVGHSSVIYGTFFGLQLPRSSTWGSADRASMMLGMYEMELVSKLKTLSGSKTHFIDIGAADGFYAVGSLVANLFPKVICFEISEKSQFVIAECASLNQVESRLTILGEATYNFPDLLQNEFQVDLARSVLLFDIEGAEANLLTIENLMKLKEATLLVEMHPVQLEPIQIKALEDIFSSTHAVSEITTQERNPAAYPELGDWLDDDRWAVCSEGRYRQGRWLVLEPN